VVGWIGSPKALGDISYSIWSDFGRRSTGNCIWHYLGCFWIVRRERERERERNIQGFCEAPMSYHQCSKHHCHMQDLFWTTKQQQLHHRMEKREVNQEEFAATCFCVHPQFQLYPSTTFAVRRSSQNTPDRYSRGGTQRPRQLWAFLCCLFLSVYCHFLTVRVFCLQKSLGSFAMVGSPIREGNWTSNLSEFTCQCSHPGCTFGVNLVAFSLSLSLSLSRLLSILPWSKLGRNSFQVLCTGGIVVVVGSRR